MPPRTLQAPIARFPGVAIAISSEEDKPWQIAVWQYDSADTELRYEFDTVDAACAFAAREFHLALDDWMQCESCGSPLAIVDAVRHAYRRRLTRAEAAAVACLSYNYQCLDERGLFIWPSHGRYVTSYRVVAYDVLDTLDWDRGGDPFGSVSYDFAMMAIEGDLENTPEFRELWAAFTRTAHVSSWRRFDPDLRLPALTISGDGRFAALARAASEDPPLHHNWQSGAVARALGLRERERLIAVRRLWRDSSTADVARLDDGLHLILTGRQDEATDFYLTSTEGELLGAARRADDTAPLETLSRDNARRGFEHETEQWLRWLDESGAETHT